MENRYKGVSISTNILKPDLQFVEIDEIWGLFFFQLSVDHGKDIYCTESSFMEFGWFYHNLKTFFR